MNSIQEILRASAQRNQTAVEEKTAELRQLLARGARDESIRAARKTLVSLVVARDALAGLCE